MFHLFLRKGFTLIEMLVVITILAILAAIFIPAINSARSKATTTQALSNVRQIGLANLNYARDNDGQIIGGSGSLDIAALAAMGLTGNTTTNANYYTQVVIPTLKNIRDPRVPYNNSWSVSFPYTWGINEIFNMKYGRASQGISSIWNGPINPRRMSEFSSPGNIIYCLSGSAGDITLAHISNSSYLTPPTGTTKYPIFYLHGNKSPTNGYYDSTPGVFLDGHAELLKYPIPSTRLNPGVQ